jgi:hypothetical protein
MSLILAMVSASAPGNESHLRVISITCWGCRKRLLQNRSRINSSFSRCQPLKKKEANEGFHLGFFALRFSSNDSFKFAISSTKRLEKSSGVSVHNCSPF